MINKGKVVTLAYTLKSDNGEIMDQATAAEPFLYLHGYGEIVPGLENALQDKDKGFKGNVTVKPEEGYGQHEPNLVTAVERGMFPADAELEVGMRFRAEVGNQPVVFLVEKIEGEQVHINGNHPLAGQTLNFEVEVLDVRQATEEELDHGHSHGPDGHHHH